MSIMGLRETQTDLESKIPTRGIMGLKTRVMNVAHGAVFTHLPWSTVLLQILVVARTAPCDFHVHREGC